MISLWQKKLKGKENIVWYKKIPLFIIPLFITFFFFLQVSYTLDCELRSDICTIKKRANLYAEFEEDDTFNLSDIASWKIKEKKIFGIPTGKYYIVLNMYNYDFIHLKQFPTTSKKLARKMYIQMTHDKSYHNIVEHQILYEFLFFIFATITSLMLTFKYGLKKN